MPAFSAAVRAFVLIMGLAAAVAAQANHSLHVAWLELPESGLSVEENGALVLSGNKPTFARIHLRRQTAEVAYGNISTRVNSAVANIAIKSHSDEEGIVTEIDLAHNDSLRLQPGRNSIEVTFRDRRNQVHYFSFLLELPAGSIQQAAPSASFRWKPGQRYALVVGVSRYKRTDAGLRELAYAASDASALGKLLGQASGANIPPANIHVLTDEEATLENIKNAISGLRSVVRPNDLVIVYLNLHGAHDPSNPSKKYLLAYDSDPAEMNSTALETNEFAELLTHSLSDQRIVLLADTCHSESLQETGSAVPPANLVNQYLARAAKEAGFASLEASDIGQLSAEGQPWHEHAAFTYYLMKGLSGEADINRDGTVTARELFSYVRKHVLYDTNNAQLPISELGMAGDIPIGGMMTAKRIATSSSK